jgi:hypothetical protein
MRHHHNTETQPVNKQHRSLKAFRRLLAEFCDEIACNREEEFSGLDRQPQRAEERNFFRFFAFFECRLARHDPEIGVEKDRRPARQQIDEFPLAL